MAGPYVHCLVSRESLNNLYSDTLLNRYRSITNPDENAPYFPYVCLGSVSPDYPYPALAIQKINSRKDDNGWTWGDKFHKQHAGNFIDIGIQELRKGITDRDRDFFLKKIAWLMGYFSHVITDLVIHAVVYDLVGGCYENHKHDHLHCEVIQDSLLFYDVYSNPPRELVDAHFFSILQKCEEKVFQDNILDPPKYILDKDIKDFWDFILRQNYSDFYTTEPPQIDEWDGVYGDLMKLGTSVLARTLDPTEAYHKTADIDDNDRTRYYTDITLPDETRGDYKNKVFNKAVDEVTKRLKEFLNALDNTDLYLALRRSLGEWNLDKGTIDSNNPQFALWNGKTEYPFKCDGDPPNPS